jgi:hypothetical protein
MGRRRHQFSAAASGSPQRRAAAGARAPFSRAGIRSVEQGPILWNGRPFSGAGASSLEQPPVPGSRTKVVGNFREALRISEKVRTAPRFVGRTFSKVARTSAPSCAAEPNDPERWIEDENVSGSDQNRSIVALDLPKTPQDRSRSSSAFSKGPDDESRNPTDFAQGRDDESICSENGSRSDENFRPAAENWRQQKGRTALQRDPPGGYEELRPASTRPGSRGRPVRRPAEPDSGERGRGLPQERGASSGRD